MLRSKTKELSIYRRGNESLLYQCEDLTRNMLHAVTTTHEKASHITRADTNFTRGTMTEIQLVCYSEHTYIQYETNILQDHVNNKNSVHGLAVLTGFSIVPEKGRPL